MRIVQNAHAKINWAIDVIDKRPDGYHEIDMLMQSIALNDEMTFETSPELTLNVGTSCVPHDGKNLIIRAANALREYAGVNMGANITLKKRIPVRAGLGGGSADCAATLIALNRLWDLRIPMSKLSEIGAGLGKDVPFCMGLGAARVRGTGEKLTRLKSGVNVSLLIVHPGMGLSTQDVYAKWDDMRETIPRPDIESAQKALTEGDIGKLALYSQNALEPPACALMPEISLVRAKLEQLGSKFARMTGSGSAVFAVFDTPALCERAASRLKRRAIITKTL